MLVAQVEWTHGYWSAHFRRGLTGAKHEPFAAWLRVLFGYREGDVIVDLFPSSGACTDSTPRTEVVPVNGMGPQPDSAHPTGPVVVQITVHTDGVSITHPTNTA